MKLTGYSRPTCNKLLNFVHPATARSTVVAIIHKFDRRRVLLITPSLAMAKFSKSRVWGNLFIYFRRYANFLIAQFRTGQRKLLCQNQCYTSSRLDKMPACDGQTDRHMMTLNTVLAYRPAVKLLYGPLTARRESANSGNLSMIMSGKEAVNRNVFKR